MTCKACAEIAGADPSTTCSCAMYSNGNLVIGVTFSATSCLYDPTADVTSFVLSTTNAEAYISGTNVYAKSFSNTYSTAGQTVVTGCASGLKVSSGNLVSGNVVCGSCNGSTGSTTISCQ